MDMYGDIVPRFLYFVPSPKAKLGGLQGQWRDALEDLLLGNFMIRVLFGKPMKMSNHVSWMNEPFLNTIAWYVVFDPEVRLYVVDGTDVHITRESDGQTASIVLVEHNVKVPCPESSEAAKCISNIDEWSMRASTNSFLNEPSRNSTNFIQLLQPIYLTKV